MTHRSLSVTVVLVTISVLGACAAGTNPGRPRYPAKLLVVTPTLETDAGVGGHGHLCRRRQHLSHGLGRDRRDFANGSLRDVTGAQRIDRARP